MGAVGYLDLEEESLDTYLDTMRAEGMVESIGQRTDFREDGAAEGGEVGGQGHLVGGEAS